MEQPNKKPKSSHQEELAATRDPASGRRAMDDDDDDGGLPSYEQVVAEAKNDNNGFDDAEENKQALNADDGGDEAFGARLLVHSDGLVLPSSPPPQDVDKHAPHHPPPPADAAHLVVIQSLAGDARPRMPVDMVWVLDISGSMNMSVDGPATSAAERTNLSRLDLVKHAVRTGVRQLGDGDRIALTVFSGAAWVLLPPTPFDPATTPRLVDELLDCVKPLDQTSLWQGLVTSLALFLPDARREELLRAHPPQLSRGCGATMEAETRDVLARAQAAAAPQPADPPPPLRPWCQKNGRNGVILLLTDGQPTADPPRGAAAVLAQTLAAFPELGAITISTFLFGKEGPSDLLSEIATLGAGTPCYISDANMLATTMIHQLANLLVMRAAHLTLELTSSSGFLRVGEDPWVASPIKVKLGFLQQGQDRHVLVHTREPDSRLTAVASWVDQALPGGLVAKTLATPARVPLAQLLALEALERARVVAALGRLRGVSMARDAAVLDEVLASLSDTSPFATDLASEVRLAIASHTWGQWGKAYVTSFRAAHASQLCLNFKDKSMQRYGGSLCKQIQARCEATFAALPAPTPSLLAASSRVVGGGGGGGGVGWGFSLMGGGKGGKGGAPRAAAPPSRDDRLDMSARFNNVNSGCFSGTTRVWLMGNDTELASAHRHAVPLQSLGRGDKVATVNPVTGVVEAATVRALVVFPQPTTPCPLYGTANNAQLTAYHPVVKWGKAEHGVSADKLVWQFASHACATPTSSSWCVYNLVLDHSHLLLLVGGGDEHQQSAEAANSVDMHQCCCPTLGHGLQDGGGGVLAHPFYGTKACVEQLQKLPGWDRGRIVVRESVKCPVTGLTIGFRA